MLIHKHKQYVLSSIYCLKLLCHRFNVAGNKVSKMAYALPKRREYIYLVYRSHVFVEAQKDKISEILTRLNTYG